MRWSKNKILSRGCYSDEGKTVSFVLLFKVGFADSFTETL